MNAVRIFRALIGNDKKGLRFLPVFFLLIMLPVACKTTDTVTVGTIIGVATGTIDQSQAEKIKKVARSFEDITPEQEYYIGRTVGAVVVNRYKPYNHSRLNSYLNILGQTLAQSSDLPETFGGYHFLVLDVDEINAFAAPGGLIFITRGLLRCCESEDALAAVLAHEISHVQYKHGLQAIKKSRITAAVTALAATGARALGGEDLAALANAFEGSVGDIVTTMINNGYSRTFEQEADRGAVTILNRLGYNPNALVEMLKIMEKRLIPGGTDFASTHPSPNNRIADIGPFLDSQALVEKSGARQARFNRIRGDI